MKPILKTVRFAIEYGLFRFVGIAYGAMPLEFASALSGWFWRRLGPFNKRHSRALANLRAAFPEKTDAELKAIVTAMWDNLGRVFAESFHLHEIADSERIVIEPLEAVRALAASGKPIVVCAPHLSNWELVVVGLVRPGLRPAGIYQKIKNPYVDAFAGRMRGPLYPGGLFPKEPATPKRLMQHARAGGTVAFLADLRDARGVKVPFFGRPAASTAFPAVVARTFSARLFAGYMVREPKVRFRARMEEVAVPKTGNRDADIEAATAAVQAVFERAIRSAPGQWMWTHRRWD